MTENAELIAAARLLAARRFVHKVSFEREMMILKLVDALEAAERRVGSEREMNADMAAKVRGYIACLEADFGYSPPPENHFCHPFCESDCPNGPDA